MSGRRQKPNHMQRHGGASSVGAAPPRGPPGNRRTTSHPRTPSCEQARRFAESSLSCYNGRLACRIHPLPSSTVENYLKAILQAQQRLDGEGALVPMGRLAQALGITPGTATTMVKALADAQLVAYAPYAGVRLTPNGERLATMVLRRHRIVELFLVEVLGLSWTEVHDEAERLEHAVSDRVIEAMDVMLGRPDADPHGDPIPTRVAACASPTTSPWSPARSTRRCA